MVNQVTRRRPAPTTPIALPSPPIPSHPIPYGPPPARSSSVSPTSGHHRPPARAPNPICARAHQPLATPVRLPCLNPRRPASSPFPPPAATAKSRSPAGRGRPRRAARQIQPSRAHRSRPRSSTQTTQRQRGRLARRHDVRRPVELACSPASVRAGGGRGKPGRRRPGDAATSSSSAAAASPTTSVRTSHPSIFLPVVLQDEQISQGATQPYSHFYILC
jgi:hypothetical protein